MKQGQNTAWDTRAEIEYLQGIGTFHEALRGKPKLELLKKYQSAMPERKRWGQVSHEAVKEQVERMIKGKGESF